MSTEDQKLRVPPMAYDADTQEPLEGYVGPGLARASDGKVVWARHREGEWLYVPSADVAWHHSLGHELRRVYVL